jgi:DNA-binding transcriptional LysR family regulator
MRFDGRLLSGASIFVTVVEAGSFAQAAKRLGLTPSGILRAVSRLEFRLGIKLFTRQARGVRLSPEGCAFFENITSAVGLLERVVTAIAERSTYQSGRLTVVVDTAFGSRILASRLWDFLDENPDLVQRFRGTTRIMPPYRSYRSRCGLRVLG